MDRTILDFKLYSYMACMLLAEKAGDRARAKKAAGLAVILLRMQARDAVRALVSAIEEERVIGRAMVKVSEEGLKFPLGEQRLKQLGEVSALKRKNLAAVGASVCTALDLWQSYGATIHDLANLCNRSYDDVAGDIAPGRLGMEFSGLVFVYNLDYKDNRNRGWIDFDVDAPLTHAVKEYWTSLMLNTKEGREASHKALVECFPEIWDSRIYRIVDADGTVRFIDKDGVEIGEADPGE